MWKFTDSIYGPTKNPWKYNFYSTHCEDQQNKFLEQVGMRSYHTLTDDWHVAGGSSGIYIYHNLFVSKDLR
jgi:Asp-tRNA(Asn)/Glu-tRNA(Gln) amidotransferase A subunit family amidase